MNIIDNEFIDDFTFTVQPDELTVLRKLYKDVIPSVNAIIEYINSSFDDEMKALLLSRFNELILDIMYEPNNELLKFFLKDKPSLEVPSFLIWNESAMSFEFNMNALVTATLCEDVNYPPAKNGTNATITNGKVVMLDDVQGSSGFYTVKPADATAVGFDRYKVLGIATQDIIKNTSGIITRLGMVNNIDTSGTPYGETWEEGDRLYLSPTVAGGMTNVRPTDTTKIVYIGTVFIKNATNGSLYVDKFYPVSKTELALENVNNTSDANKPISTATQVALNLKADTTALTSHTGRVDNPHSVTKSQVGLGNVDNTSDVNKPISIAQQTALNLKVDNTALTSHTGRVDNPHSVTKSQVGLGNVPNVDTNSQTPTYTVAGTLAAIVSGETLAVAFGKIKKAITDFITHITVVSGMNNIHGIQTGTANITSVANTPTSVTITFPVAYSTAPQVFAIPRTSVPATQVTGFSVNNITTTGFDFVITRTTATTTGFSWVAIP